MRIPKDLFGRRIIPQEWWIFHDESGIFGNTKDKWVVIGLLFVQKEKANEIYRRLLEYRIQETCFSKIHFADIQKDFEGKHNAKARIAKMWFIEGRAYLGNGVKYYAIAINQKHPKFEWKRFSERFHAYNRFTALALKSAFAWLFSYVEEIAVRIFSDKKIDRPKSELKKLKSDNFHQYLSYRIATDTSSIYKGPQVKLLCPVESLVFPKDKFSHKNLPPPELEFLQLSDLFTSSIREALAPKSRRETKQWFALEIAKIIQDIQKKRREQKFNLHREFGISYFPDQHGSFYQDEHLKILDVANDVQLTLF